MKCNRSIQLKGFNEQTMTQAIKINRSSKINCDYCARLVTFTYLLYLYNSLSWDISLLDDNL